MDKWDERYKLSNMVELEEGFFATEVLDNGNGKSLKRGRGGQRKTKTLVMVETMEGITSKKNHKYTAIRHTKMIIIDVRSAKTIDPEVKEFIESSSTIISDESTYYTNYKPIVTSHCSQVIPKEKVDQSILWVHIAINNAKRLFLDVYHDLCHDYIQNYLSEFFSKFNHRTMGNVMFNRLVVAKLGYNYSFKYII